MNKKKVAIKNTITSLIYQIIAIISGFIVPRLLLLNYGSDINGLVSSVSQFIAYLTLFELGLSQAATLALYKPVHDKNHDEINSSISSIHFFYLKIARLYSIGIIILCIVYPYISNQSFDHSFIRIIIAILATQNIIDYLGMAKYKALLMADQKLYVITYAQMLSTVLYIIFSWVCCTMGASIIVVKLMAPTTYFIRFLIVRGYIGKHYRWINYNNKVSNIERLKQRGVIVLHQITGLIVNSTDVTVLTLLGTTMSEISVYTVYNMVLTEINGLLNSIFSGILPSFGSYIANEDKKRFGIVFEQYCFGFYLLSFVVFSCMFQLLGGFIELYTSGLTGVQYFRKELIVLFVGIGLVNAVKSPLILLISAGGYYEETKIDTIIEAILNIAISIPLCIIIGIPGVLIGTLVAHLFRLVRLIFAVKKFDLCINVSRITKMIILNLTIFILSIIISLNINKMVTYQTWVQWLIIGIISILGYSTLYAITNFLLWKDLMKKLVSVFFIRRGMTK